MKKTLLAIMLTFGMAQAGSYGNYYVTQNQFNTFITNYSTSVTNITNKFESQAKLANQATAGAVALSSIDFGTTCKGKTEIGLGAGTADAFGSREYAGAIGVKYGFTDSTAAVVKGWKSKNTDAVGVGLTYKF